MRLGASLVMPVLLLLAPSAARAQDSTEVVPYRTRLIALPYVTYSPQTRLQFGVAGGLQFKWPGSARDPATRPSYLAANLAYTTKGQWITYAETASFTPGSRWWLFGRASVALFPLFYYGVGPHTETADTNLMEHRYVKLEVKALRRVAGNLFAGPYYRLHSYYDMDWQFPGRIPDTLPGSDGGVSSGVGLSVQYDARNSITTPTRGSFLLLDYLQHLGALGSDFTYGSLVLDGRYYLPVRAGRDVIALNLYAQFNGPEVPVQSMAMISTFGTSYVARGVYLGRFRDRHEAAFQADYRGHLKGRFGYVVFGTAGNVFGSPGNDLFDDLKFTGGAGLRFNVNPADPLNIRVDYTLTSFGESGLSIGAAEAF